MSLKTLFRAAVLPTSVLTSASVSASTITDAVNVRGGFDGGRRKTTSSVDLVNLTFRCLATGATSTSRRSSVDASIATRVGSTALPSPKRDQTCSVNKTVRSVTNHASALHGTIGSRRTTKALRSYGPF